MDVVKDIGYDDNTSPIHVILFDGFSHNTRSVHRSSRPPGVKCWNVARWEGGADTYGVPGIQTYIISMFQNW